MTKIHFAGRIALAALAVSLFAVVQNAAAITVDFSNLDNSAITFNAGAFTFTSSGTDQFSITGVQGGAGTSIGLDGYVAPGGPFTIIGPISISGGVQSANVSGTGTLNIIDGASIPLTGTIVWDNIYTFGVGGTLDLTGTVNLTNILYAGTNTDLEALAAGSSATDVVTFQFVPAETLTQLAAASNLSTSYSGSITSVPEPTAVTLLGMGFMSFLTFRRARK